MFNFFAQPDSRHGNTFLITGSDYNHIINVLRMKPGDTLLVSCNAVSHLCRLTGWDEVTAQAEILEENYQNTELPVQIYLFQGLPKSDKMEWIIQKTVELGVAGIIPVEMERCVVRLEDKKRKSKQIRWQAICESAAKQSKRTVVPEVFEPMSFPAALAKARELDVLLVPYENKQGMGATKEALDAVKPAASVGIFIGPEGGFTQREIDAAMQAGGKIISLGKRILRTETAAIASVGLCMLHIEMNGEQR